NGTNAMEGIVERNGCFWMEDLPLFGGTNTLSITAMDAASNIMTTNISIVQSSVDLAITNIDGDLNDLAVTVQGTINTSGYTIWVNGVRTNISTNGTWTAENVPLNEGGTVVIQARAIPNSDNSGNGSGGGGTV